MKKKHFAALPGFLPFYILFPAFYWVTGQIFGWLYPSLSELLPTIFPTYNKIHEREAYEMLEASKALVTSLLTLAIINFLSVLYDGRRYEATIEKTDGLFRVKNELPSYFRRNLLPDVIASSLLQIPFIIATTIPLISEVKRFVDPILLPHAVIVEPCGIPAAYLLIFLVSFSVRVFSSPLVLKRHRVMWITAFVGEEDI